MSSMPPFQIKQTTEGTSKPLSAKLRLVGNMLNQHIQLNILNLWEIYLLHMIDRAPSVKEVSPITLQAFKTV